MNVIFFYVVASGKILQFLFSQKKFQPLLWIFFAQYKMHSAAWSHAFITWMHGRCYWRRTRNLQQVSRDKKKMQAKWERDQSRKECQAAAQKTRLTLFPPTAEYEQRSPHSQCPDMDLHVHFSPLQKLNLLPSFLPLLSLTYSSSKQFQQKIFHVTIKQPKKEKKLG
jgi:hypothetical protein